MFTNKKKNFPESGHQTLFHKGKVISTLRITHSSKTNKNKQQKTKHNCFCKQNLIIYFELFVGCTETKENLQKQAKTTMFGMKHKFLLSSQFPYVHDQPLAVVLMVNGLHIHHCSLDPGLILLDKQKEKPICITEEIRLQGLLHILTHTCMHALTHTLYL